MAMTRREILAIGAAGLVAVAVPAWLLLDAAAGPAAAPDGPLALPRSDPPAAVYRRALFTASAAGADAPVDAPELAGIAGRIGQDAVALVRTDAGRTRTVAIGEGVDGWTLTALSPDAASFSRGGRDVRVPLPAGE